MSFIAMRTALLFGFGFLTPLLAELALMPQPAKVNAGQGKLRIDGSFCVAITGAADARLQSGAERMVRLLSRQTGIPMNSRPAAGAATLTVHADRAGERVQSVAEVESYRLEVTPTGAQLNAETAVGVLRGLETFRQLVTLDADGFAAPAVSIDDAPRFPWRGLLIDVCRHWMPPEVIRRNLDGMAAVKLNVLHLHLSDDQGFRVESKRYPKLQELGSDGHYFTQAELRGLIGYARDLGIRIMPEFDIPGHTGAWFPGYPDLASAAGPYSIARKWGVLNPCMDPTKEETYRFLDGLIGEMAALFPDAYFHIGGDEVNGKQWDANPKIMAFKRAHGMRSNGDLQAYFNQRVETIVARHGKTMIGWDEILHPKLPTSIVVQSWCGPKSLAEAAKAGYRGILSSGYYLDLMLPASYHYAVDPMGHEAGNLTTAEQARILGGEACMWAEYVSPEIVDSRIWPRLAAIAERLWSPREVNDVASMYRRMAVVSRDLEWLSLTHRSNYAPMLERLAGNGKIERLKVLADVVEPVKNYDREKVADFTSLTPLNRLVDAARPESDEARQFAGLVERMPAKGTPERARMRRMLTKWRDNHIRLLPQLQASFLLREVIPVSADLSAISAAGIEALDLLDAGRTAPEAWYKEQLALLDRAQGGPTALMLPVIPSIRKLLDAAGPRP